MVEYLLQLRHHGQDVVAGIADALKGFLGGLVDLSVEIVGQIRLEADIAVGDEVAHLFFVKFYHRVIAHADVPILCK